MINLFPNEAKFGLVNTNVRNFKMNDQNLEPEGENLLRTGKNNADTLSVIPALYSIAISLKRIADVITAPSPQMPELTPEQLKQFEEVWNKSSSPFTPFI